MGRAKEKIKDTFFEYIDEWSAWKAVIQLAESSDAFGKTIADGTTNEADISAEYDFSPERWRLYKDGSRQFVQYGETANFDDAEDSHILQPDANMTMKLETAERFRYIVQYVIKPSQALSINQDLQTGDYIGFGYGDDDIANSTMDSPGPNADGWFIYTNSSLYPDVRVTEYRDGVEIDGQKVSLPKGLKIWSRYAAEINWYNVGNAKWEETYTNDAKQINETIARTAGEDIKGPIAGNQHVFFSVKTGSGTNNLELDCGSVGLQTLGTVRAITRDKTETVEGKINTADAWVPLGAYRVDPDRQSVNVQLSNIDVVSFESNEDLKVMALAVDPSKTDASTWTTPTQLSPANSVIQEADTVTTFPDSGGTEVNQAQNPGGYQLGFGSWYASGTGSKTNVSSGSKTRKRQISNGDIVVFVGYASATGD
ncbi:MAG: hypothetical protein ACNS64_09245, partial [Candidatus Halalkalibacterium sp. M3_1C_030]